VALYSITLKQLIRSPLVPLFVALGALCFSLYNPLHTSYQESDRIENVFLGFVCAAVQILAVWAMARYWHYWYRLITRTGSVWHRSFTRASFAVVGILAFLISCLIIYNRERQILPPLNLDYGGIERLVVLSGVTIWIVSEVLVEVAIVTSVVSILGLGLAALLSNRKAIRLWWVNKCRCRGTCRYPRAPY
jgi:hypothetical protein